jgi:exopolyphosphatase/guanosine-5'-triphosphate,3'-diphosphate pyrophosphatase
MRVAAIDIGTNSIHMIVAEIAADLSFQVIDREKEMVRLGAGGLDGRALTPEAMHAALQVLSNSGVSPNRIAVDETIAVATSATREAENGGDFLKAVTHQTGIRPRVISGTEEARLIHLAAVYGVGLPGDAAVVIDIGGGSVEVTRGTGSSVDLGRSFKLGVIRLTERFVKSDPLEGRDERKLVRHIDEEVGKHLDQIARAGFDRVIGTSGTILSLGAVAAATDGRAAPTTLRNRRVPAKQLRRVRKDLVAIDLEERLRVPGLEPRRADLAVAGSILLDEIVRRLGASDITLCDMSLREGLVLDYIARHRKQIAQADRYPDIRRRSVFELAERCNYWPEHSQQVARLAVALFDQTRGIHGMTDREREWLEYAAILPRYRCAYQLRAASQTFVLFDRNGDFVASSRTRSKRLP